MKAKIYLKQKLQAKLYNQQIKMVEKSFKTEVRTLTVWEYLKELLIPKKLKSLSVVLN